MSRSRAKGLIQDKGKWLLRWNNVMCGLHIYLNIMVDIKFIRPGWVGHVPVKVLIGKLKNKW